MTYLKINGYKLALCCLFILSGCSSNNLRDQRFVEPTEQDTNKVYVDDSQKGSVNVYASPNTEVALYENGQVISLMPTLPSSALYKITLVDLDSKYTIQTISNQGTSSYEIEASDLDTSILTMPNTMVNFNKSSLPVIKAKELYEYSTSDIDFIKKVCSFTCHKLEYSTKDLISENYIVNIDYVYTREYGVCTDYATIACAMLRSQGVPTRLVYGTRDGVSHAWCECILNDETILVDPTMNMTYEVMPSNYVSQYKY